MNMSSEKNLANKRLKRLRAALNNEIETSDPPIVESSFDRSHPSTKSSFVNGISDSQQKSRRRIIYYSSYQTPSPVGDNSKTCSSETPSLKRGRETFEENSGDMKAAKIQCVGKPIDPTSSNSKKCISSNYTSKSNLSTSNYSPKSCINTSNYTPKSNPSTSNCTPKSYLNTSNYTPKSVNDITLNKLPEYSLNKRSKNLAQNRLINLRKSLWSDENNMDAVNETRIESFSPCTASLGERIEISHNEPMLSEPMDEDIPKPEEVRTPKVGIAESDTPNVSVDCKLSVNSPEPPEQKIKKKEVCVVVDTNILLHNLEILRKVTDAKYVGEETFILYLPWMVLTELDFLKSRSKYNNSTQRNAINAIKFINDCLMSHSDKMKGETVLDVNDDIHVGPNPDDKIICCCLQVSKKYDSLILLSNDVNLRNKAMLHHIQTCSPSEFLLRLRKTIFTSPKIQTILQKLTLLCSFVICESAKEAYGDVWTSMDLLNVRPWTLKGCLKIFKKYWNSVFKEKVLKQFEKAIEDMEEFLDICKNVDEKSEEFRQFIYLSQAFCVFFQDIKSARDMAVKIKRDIQEIYQNSS